MGRSLSDALASTSRTLTTRSWVVNPTAGLTAWLEANRGKRLRLPVVIELGEQGGGFKRSRVGSVELRVTDGVGYPPWIERFFNQERVGAQMAPWASAASEDASAV
jgi:hypothetical protein